MAEPELIAAYQPDMILMTYTTAGEADELQSKTSCPVIVVDYGDFNQNIDKFFGTLEFLGKLLNKEKRAEELTAEINAYIFDLNKRTYTSPATESVYVGGIAYRGSHGINSTEPMYAPFRFVNADNVAENLGEVTSSPKAWLENAFIDKEQLIEWNPDMIFIDAAGLQLVDKDLSDLNFSSLLKAVRNQQTYVVLPHNWYTTNYENIICNAYYIGKVMYPESFINIDIEKRCGNIYRKFLGVNVYDSMMSQYNAYGRYE
jgi:iron complex transport system substrate-binding protein